MFTCLIWMDLNSLKILDWRWICRLSVYLCRCIAALVPVVVSCAEAGDEVPNKILQDSVEELALSVKAVVERLSLCGEDGKSSFPHVVVYGVLEANKKWDIGKEVVNSICRGYPGVLPIRPKALGGVRSGGHACGLRVLSIGVLHGASTTTSRWAYFEQLQLQNQTLTNKITSCVSD